MKIIDIKKMFLRTYIKYLLDEVTVTPKKDFSIEFLGENIVLIVGEEKKLPRFIAEVLERHGIVKIEEDVDRKALVGRLMSMMASRRDLFRLAGLPHAFYCKIAELLTELAPAVQEKIIEDISQMMNFRALSIIHRLHTRKFENLDILEQEFFKKIIEIYGDFVKHLPREMASIVEHLKKLESKSYESANTTKSS